MFPYTTLPTAILTKMMVDFGWNKKKDKFVRFGDEDIVSTENIDCKLSKKNMIHKNAQEIPRCHLLILWFSLRSAFISLCEAAGSNYHADEAQSHSVKNKHIHKQSAYPVYIGSMFSAKVFQV